MTAICLICHHRTPDHADDHACQVCADELRAWLTELPRQALLLEEFLTPGARPAEGRLGGTGRAHSPAPVDIRVLTLIGPGRYDPRPGSDDDGTAPIAAVLDAWAGHIAYHYPAVTRDPHGTAHTQPCEQAQPAHGPTITGWCTWLTTYLPYTLTLPTITDLHQAISNLIHRLRDLTHERPHTHRYAAPCPSCEAHDALTRTDGHHHITCQACGHHLTPQTYEEHLNTVLSELAAQQAPDQSLAQHHLHV